MEWKSELIDLILNQLQGASFSRPAYTITYSCDHIIGHLNMLVYCELIEKCCDGHISSVLSPEGLIRQYQLTGKGEQYVRYMKLRETHAA